MLDSACLSLILLIIEVHKLSTLVITVFLSSSVIRLSISTSCITNPRFLICSAILSSSFWVLGLISLFHSLYLSPICSISSLEYIVAPVSLPITISITPISSVALRILWLYKSLYSWAVYNAVANAPTTPITGKAIPLSVDKLPPNPATPLVATVEAVPIAAVAVDAAVDVLVSFPSHPKAPLIPVDKLPIPLVTPPTAFNSPPVAKVSNPNLTIAFCVSLSKFPNQSIRFSNPSISSVT